MLSECQPQKELALPTDDNQAITKFVSASRRCTPRVRRPREWSPYLEICGCHSRHYIATRNASIVTGLRCRRNPRPARRRRRNQVAAATATQSSWDIALTSRERPLGAGSFALRDTHIFSKRYSALLNPQGALCGHQNNRARLRLDRIFLRDSRLSFFYRSILPLASISTGVDFLTLIMRIVAP